MEQMIDASEQAHRQKLMEKIEASRALASKSTTQRASKKQAALPPAAPAMPATPTPTRTPVPSLAQPLAPEPLPPTPIMPTASPPKTTQNSQAQAVTTPANPDILKLVHNDDLNVETLARQASKNEEPPEDQEVVISLR